MNVLDVVGTGLDMAQQAANVYDTFRGDRGTSDSSGTVVNQNHYHSGSAIASTVLHS